jgi:mannose-6-phosphate isomerase-like protein (cupin superfamily)
MKFGGYDVGGEIVKKDDRYIVKDNKTLTNLIVSSTTLHPGKSTSGHSHAGQEEVYQFVYGQGEMVVDGDRFQVMPGDVVLIPDGAFHRVFNTHVIDLYFVCVFDGKRNH